MDENTLEKIMEIKFTAFTSKLDGIVDILKSQNTVLENLNNWKSNLHREFVPAETIQEYRANNQSEHARMMLEVAAAKEEIKELRKEVEVLKTWRVKVIGQAAVIAFILTIIADYLKMQFHL